MTNRVRRKPRLPLKVLRQVARMTKEETETAYVRAIEFGASQQYKSALLDRLALLGKEGQ